MTEHLTPEDVVEEVKRIVWVNPDDYRQALDQLDDIADLVKKCRVNSDAPKGDGKEE
ncbi:MAG: hypothetical protein WC935_00160 [Thermoleophilia bacterium]